MLNLPPPPMMNRMSPGVLPSGSPSAGLPGMLPSMTQSLEHPSVVPPTANIANGETTPDSSSSPRAPPVTYPQSSMAPSVSIPSLVAAQSLAQSVPNPGMPGYTPSVEFGSPSLAPSALWPTAWSQGYYNNK